MCGHPTPLVIATKRSSTMQSGIFLCYRRADDPGYVQAILARLERVIPPQDIFIDIESIKPGTDFVQMIESRLRSCAVLLAIIGQKWLQITNERGTRSLDDPDDWVRQEITTAMQLEKTVIPVLVGPINAPSADQLPEPLKPLARKQALRLSHESFRADAQRLIAAIAQSLNPQAEAVDTRLSRSPGISGLLGNGGRVCLTFFVFGILAALLSEIVSSAFPPIAAPAAPGPGIAISFLSNAVAAAPYAVAWPLAAYMSGFRSIRTLSVITLIFFVSWIVTAIYWENWSLLPINTFPVDRELISTMIYMGGWAIYFPRLRKFSYFLAAATIAIFGASANYAISHVEMLPYFAKLELASLALNVPLFLLIGYGISRRQPSGKYAEDMVFLQTVN
jgi:TIR domain